MKKINLTLNTLPSNPGVYLIKQINNNRIYVGSTKNLKQRFYAHNGELRRGVHNNPFLLNVYNKYELEFIILEIFNSKKEAYKHEKIWYDYYMETGKFELMNLEPPNGKGGAIQKSGINSPRFKDYSDQAINGWKILSFHHQDKFSRSYFKVVCPNCGKELIKRIEHLFNHDSCRCKFNKIKYDYSGTIFDNKWEVIKPQPKNKPGHTKYLARCTICGEERISTISHIKNWVEHKCYDK